MAKWSSLVPFDRSDFSRAGDRGLNREWEVGDRALDLSKQLCCRGKQRNGTVAGDGNNGDTRLLCEEVQIHLHCIFLHGYQLSFGFIYNIVCL